MGIASGMKELAQEIASSHDDRTKRLGEIREEAKQARGEARKLTKDFQASRKDTGAQLRSDLARDKAHRESEAKGILREAQRLTTGFRTSRKKASSQLRKDLSAGAADRRLEVRETLRDAQQLIRGFQTSRKGMGSDLRKELSQSNSSTKSEVRGLLRDAQELVKDFGKAQAEVKADIKEAAATWQDLASTMQAKKAGVKVSPKKEKVEVPVMGEEVKVAEEVTDLEAKLLAFIERHPSGVALLEAGKDLGVATIALGRSSRSLVEKGKIRKEDRLYFPVGSE
jgi:hypothetical protein